jgi:hypothetical protein
MKKLHFTAAVVVLFASGTALFYARCSSPSFDQSLGFPLNQQVKTCSLK